MRGDFLQIKTKRLTIKPFAPQYFEDTFNIYKSEENTKYLLAPQWTLTNKEAEFAKKLVNNELTEKKHLSLAVLENDQVIGDISVHPLDMKESVELGYAFSPIVGGRGIATEAVRAVIKYLFEDFNGFYMHRIQTNIDALHPASQRVSEKVGLRKEAEFKQDYWYKGRWSDSTMFGMLNSEYYEKRDSD